MDSSNTPIYFQTNSPTALSVNGKELIGHGTEHHPSGFGSPVGKLEGINIAIEDMSPKDLEVYGIVEGKTTRLNFEGGVTVEGKIITGKRDLQGKIILITFKNCRVTHFETVLFDPSWGVYDMAIGKTYLAPHLRDQRIQILLKTSIRFQKRKPLRSGIQTIKNNNCINYMKRLKIIELINQ